MEELEEKEKLGQLEEMFGWWKSAENIDLKLLGKGWAKAELQITDDILSPHPMPMVVGKEIESAAAKVGFLAVATLVYENEYAVYWHEANLPRPAILEPTVPEEKSLIITARVSNDRLARRDLVEVCVKVESIYNRPKADFVFFYRVLLRDVMEQKLMELKNLANRAEKVAN